MTEQPTCGWSPIAATTDCDWDRSCSVHGEGVEPTHEGPDPSHGGLTKHRGTREQCSGPDCGTQPTEYRFTDQDGNSLTVIPGPDHTSGTFITILADQDDDLDAVALELPVDQAPTLAAAILAAAKEVQR